MKYQKRDQNQDAKPAAQTTIHNGLGPLDVLLSVVFALLWMTIYMYSVEGHSATLNSDVFQNGVITVTAGPASPTNITSATFTIAGNINTFQLTNFICAIDGKTSPCGNSYTKTGLAAGPHTLVVTNKSVTA